ncbi:MAG: hypothetical protein AB7I27_03420 [Bacteriovoracaceae bacterium]|nr:hypothetical protein [Bacteriovoracaceae bacterium]
MKMILLIVLTISSISFAEEVKSSKKETKSSVQEIVKEGKSSRKKKVEMCHDCGKPESQCDCEGEDHKKDE